LSEHFLRTTIYAAEYYRKNLPKGFADPFGAKPIILLATSHAEALVGFTMPPRESPYINNTPKGMHYLWEASLYYSTAQNLAWDSDY